MVSVTGYLSCNMPAHLFPLCELPSSREYGCATIRLHQGKTEICGLFYVKKVYNMLKFNICLCAQDRDNAVDLGSVYK